MCCALNFSCGSAPSQLSTRARLHAQKSHQLRPPLHLLRGSVSTKIVHCLQETAIDGAQWSRTWGHPRLVDCRRSAWVAKKPSAKERIQHDKDLHCAPRRCFDQAQRVFAIVSGSSQLQNVRGTQFVNRAPRCSVVFYCVPSSIQAQLHSNVPRTSIRNPPSSTSKTFIVPKKGG